MKARIRMQSVKALVATLLKEVLTDWLFIRLPLHCQFKAMQDMQNKRRDPAVYENEISKRRNMERARNAAMAGNLPAGWGTAKDPESGQPYFYDKETKATAWEPPEEMLAAMVAILEEQQRDEMNAIVEKVKKEQ